MVQPFIRISCNYIVSVVAWAIYCFMPSAMPNSSDIATICFLIGWVGLVALFISLRVGSP